MNKILSYINPLRPYFIRMGFLLFVSRHWVSLLFEGSKYWLAFHSITHFSMMFMAIALLLYKPLTKWDKLAMELTALFCLYDFIDRTFCNVYKFELDDWIIVGLAL